MRLNNKIAIVTGAGGGMGLQTVKCFLGEGAQVMAADLNLERIEEEIGRDNQKCHIVKTDITSQTQVEDLMNETINDFGRIDILVNMAGTAQAATPIEKVTNEMWDQMMAINAKSLFLTCRAVASEMKKQQKGSIINVGSISAVRPRPGLNAYVTSKGAALAFTQSLAIELADYKIRVNAINPGPSETNMLGQFVSKGTDINEAKDKVFKSSVPIGELIQPEDIANAAVYLGSDEAIRVTGSIFNIDGGRGL